MLWIIAILVIALLTFWLFRVMCGESERIKLFLRVYRKAKRGNPDFTERKLLEAVTEWHIPHGSVHTWKGDGLTGQQYMDGVFEERDIVLKELIVHLVCLEYPSKYGWQNEKIDEQLAAWRSGMKTARELRIEHLETLIEKLASNHGVILGKNGA